ncbi:MAG: hypothetical protein HKO59_04040 [Phycisphaerales bacterium]|nr:hypothetical protein [Phycisphaerae bacterium]NNF42653.1 hypothetical protein [Phycisphaerales bacterium]NNM25152.1 hypothetical protein [Phycisphaerales bacterium]
MRTLALLIAITIATLATIATAHDGTHPHEHAAAPAPPTPTIESATQVGIAPLAFEPVPGWCALPDERPLGNTHGGIVIDRAGRIYYNTDTKRAIMVHAPDGRFLKTIAPDFPGIHGMVLRAEGDEEFIYAAHLPGRQVLKLRLDGTVVWRLGVPVESGKYDDDPASYRPTAVAVAANGDVYVADGYGRNWIHHYTKERVYVRSFGGPGTTPGQFRTCHGLAIDTRGSTPRLLVCDRENRRLQRFELDGTFVDVAATNLRRPCGVSFDGPRIAVAELEGRVTILGADFEVLTHLGDNPDRGQWANNGVAAAAWKDGVFTAPHACCFDEAGNLYVMDWNATGRISKLNRRR